MNAKRRKLHACHLKHHAKLDVDGLYVSRSGGGRLLAQLEMSWKNRDCIMIYVKEYARDKKLYSVIK